MCGRSQQRGPDTGRQGAVFVPVRLERVWYSTIYDNAPMPFSIFFHRGYAIHGTNEIRNLGIPVSHGCVRLHPDNARKLFDLVLRYGKANTLDHRFLVAPGPTVNGTV